MLSLIAGLSDLTLSKISSISLFAQLKMSPGSEALGVITKLKKTNH